MATSKIITLKNKDASEVYYPKTTIDAVSNLSSELTAIEQHINSVQNDAIEFGGEKVFSEPVHFEGGIKSISATMTTTQVGTRYVQMYDCEPIYDRVEHGELIVLGHELHRLNDDEYEMVLEELTSEGYVILSESINTSFTGRRGSVYTDKDGNTVINNGVECSGNHRATIKYGTQQISLNNITYSGFYFVDFIDTIYAGNTILVNSNTFSLIDFQGNSIDYTINKNNYLCYIDLVSLKIYIYCGGFSGGFVPINQGGTGRKTLTTNEAGYTYRASKFQTEIPEEVDEGCLVYVYAESMEI